MSASIYKNDRKKEFSFNAHVVVEMLIGVPDEERTGRLVQVRKEGGRFGMDLYFIRLRDGDLRTFENVLIRHVDDKDFIRAFYISNGVQPPEVPEQEPYPGDTETATYKIMGQFPETGFIIEKQESRS